jgi:threonine/homoserine/homoserine lactone efflux protein
MTMVIDTYILAWTALATAVALSPGPDTLLVAGNAARRGRAAGLSTVAGVMCGGVFYALLCGFGFMSVLAASQTLYTVVKIAGALYLALIGAQMLWGALRRRPGAEAPLAKPGPSGAPFRQGLLTNALNPKVAVFYLAALPQFVGHGPEAPLKGVLLIAIHYAIGGAWLSVIAIGAGRAGKAFRASAAFRWLEGAAGLFLLGVAGRLVVERR